MKRNFSPIFLELLRKLGLRFAYKKEFVVLQLQLDKNISQPFKQVKNYFLQSQFKTRFETSMKFRKEKTVRQAKLKNGFLP